MGFVVTTTIPSQSSNTITVDFGSTAGGAQFVAAVQVNATASNLITGSSQSVLAGNKADSGGTAFAPFKDEAVLFQTGAEEIHMQMTIGGAVLTGATGRYRQFVKYIIVG